MQTDVRLQYEQSLDESHHGRPTIVETVYTGNRGRPRIQIDPDFLRWAYAHRSTTGISRFLHVGRNTVRRALLEYGIADPQENPFRAGLEAEEREDEDEAFILQRDDLLDPNISPPSTLPTELQSAAANTLTHNPQNAPVVSFTGPLSTLPDDTLDDLIIRLRSHFHRAGISMLDGMLRRLGHRLPRERIRESLMRVDPVQRVFQRIRICRRVYSVPGPNSLWHHDGQHGQHISPLLEFLSFHRSIFY